MLNPERDVVIVADFCGSFDGKSNNRFITIAEMLSDKCKVELITGDFCHEKKSEIKINSETLPFTLTLLRERMYRRNVSLHRFVSHFLWGREVYNYLKKRKRPDAIYTAVPTVYGAFLTSEFCRNSGVPFIIDIQDLWPDAFRIFFDIPVLSGILLYPYSIIAEKIYKRADYTFAVSQTYADRANRASKRSCDTATVYLGTDLSLFDACAQAEPILEKKDPGEIWIGYCGTLSRSYDLVCIIDAVALLHECKIRLIIMGDGPNRRDFERRSKERDVSAIFTGRLPYSEMIALLCRCDIAVNPIAHNAAQSIVNKHADYVAAGLPIISTQENKEFRDLITEFQMGFNCKTGDAEDVADKIRILIANKDLRKQMGANARMCAELLFDRGITYRPIIQTILERAGVDS